MRYVNSESRTAATDEALEILANTGPEYGDGGLANHGPLMATLAETEALNGCE